MSKLIYWPILGPQKGLVTVANILVTLVQLFFELLQALGIHNPWMGG